MKSCPVQLNKAGYDFFHQPSDSKMTVSDVAQKFGVDVTELQNYVDIIAKNYLTELRKQVGA